MREIKYGAIPTVFDGVQYRSRLEARVACFLKLHGYWFDYEPFELEGNYIPDFICELPLGTVLVECKPAIRPQEFRRPCRKITKSGWVGPALVIGSQLSLAPDGRGDLTLFGSTDAEQGGWSRVGRERWPASWGAYPFYDCFDKWVTSGNFVQWKKPVSG